MTTYLGEKPVGIGTIRATEAVGKVITDKTTILGDGFTDPLKVNTLLFATSESVAASAEAIRTEVNNKFTVVDSAIKGANEAIAKTREDYIQADSEIHQMLNGLSAETTTIKNNQASLGTQVANIEHKIPDGTTGTNSLVNKQILAQTSYTKAEVDAKVSSVYKFKGSVSTYNSLPSAATTGDVYNVTDTGANYAWDGSKWDKLSETIDLTAYATTEYVTAREQDIRSDLGEDISEVHTQVVGLSGEVAKKLNSDGDTMTGTLNVPELNVATSEGTINMSITAGVATIATNNGLDIVSQTKFDKAPTTDDNTTWANALDTSLVSKRQVAAALAESGGGDYLPLSGGTLTGALTIDGGSLGVEYGNKVLLTFKTARLSGQIDTTTISAGTTGLHFSNTPFFGVGSITPAGTGYSLGGTGQKWWRVYTTKLNNGADIAVPTTGGTMLVNQATGENSLTVGGTATGVNSVVVGVGSSAVRDAVAIGNNAKGVSGGVAIGAGADVSSSSVALPSIAIGYSAKVGASALCAIQIGTGTNNEANTLKVANTNGNFEMMDANGNVPLDRLTYVTNQIGDISTALTAILGE